jgi:hypothetical protein
VISSVVFLFDLIYSYGCSYGYMFRLLVLLYFQFFYDFRQL